MTLQSAYPDTWNTTDPDVRQALLARHWSVRTSYTDPLVAVSGHDQVAATIAGVQQRFPGFVFTALGESDAHHDQVRFSWGLGPEGAEPVVEGFDVLVTDTDGRIETVLGFLDKVPA